MHRSGIAILVLAAAALGACSGGGGSGSEIAVSVSPTPVPPAVPPAPLPAPVVPLFQPPFHALSRPPAGTLSCNPCKKIAFVRSSKIYTINADGTELTQLTFDRSADLNPAWSPDGRRIAFASDRDGNQPLTIDDNGNPQLYVMDADGSNVARLTDLKVPVTGLAWSPDGSRIVYSTSDSSMNLWEIPSSGGAPAPLFSTPGWDTEWSWSPDGAHFVLGKPWPGDPDWHAHDLFRINSDGSGLSLLTDGISTDDLDFFNPSWSPDGSRIAFTVHRVYRDSDPSVTSRGPRVTWLGVMNADGSGLTILMAPDWHPIGPGWHPNDAVSHPADRFDNPMWSPDGTTVIYEHLAYTVDDRLRFSEVAWIRVDGSARGTIITNGWSPDWQR